MEIPVYDFQVKFHSFFVKMHDHSNHNTFSHAHTPERSIHTAQTCFSNSLFPLFLNTW